MYLCTGGPAQSGGVVERGGRACFKGLVSGREAVRVWKPRKNLFCTVARHISRQTQHLPDEAGGFHPRATLRGQLQRILQGCAKRERCNTHHAPHQAQARREQTTFTMTEGFIHKVSTKSRAARARTKSPGRARVGQRQQRSTQSADSLFSKHVHGLQSKCRSRGVIFRQLLSWRGNSGISR